MASSNRHWPSMFKSKPTYTTHQDHQWQSHGSNHVITSASHRSSPYTSGCDERAPEPKPRWNPKPEQIRILESIFNSGMVNPPRDEIKKIRTRLQEYGQVGDANVFYWFQNRKSRSKNKTRHLHKSHSRQPPSVTKTSTTSSSSSSDKSLPKSSTVSVNQQPQAYLNNGELFQESFFFPVVQQASVVPSFTQEFCFNTIINQENGNNDQTVVSSTGMLFTDLMMNHQYKNDKSKGVNIVKTLTHSTPPPPPLAASTSVVPPALTSTVIPSTMNDVRGEEAGPGKLIVFINDVPFEVAVGPFNVKEAFGSDAVLIDSSGQTVVTNDWGVTTQSLQHGASYYPVRSFTYDHAGTIDLI